jgi:hypothetical protein
MSEAPLPREVVRCSSHQPPEVSYRGTSLMKNTSPYRLAADGRGGGSGAEGADQRAGNITVFRAGA